MIRVAVNGYGTIGKRVADAVTLQSDMELVGVAKTSPNHEATTARRKGYALYGAIEERMPAFEDADIELAGHVEELVAAADIVVDCCPSGIGAENAPMYEAAGTPALYQGGEAAEMVDTSFNARGNYADAEGAAHVRVVSCNTTGLSRLLAPIEEAYGVEKARVTLVRRGGDPGQTDRGPINDILPDPVSLPSHHGPDVNTIFPALDIDTLGMKVPATLMHTHSVNVTLEEPPASVEAVRALLEAESRLFLIPGDLDIDGAGALGEYAADIGRPRGDLWENCLWDRSLSLEGSDLYLFQAIHQQSDVVPENIDAIRATLGTTDRAASMEATDESLGVGLP